MINYGIIAPLILCLCGEKKTNKGTMSQIFVTMSNKELSRYEIIKNLLSGGINGTEAGKQLVVTVRHIRRLKAKVRQQGAKGLIHKSRGQKSNRKIKKEIMNKIKRYLKSLYRDFNPTHAKEKLEENHQITLSDELVRQIMIKENLWRPKPRKKNKEYRSWRSRKECFGEMEQFDGSYHDWFEERAPKCCLLASIDDATGKITKLQFTNREGVTPAFVFWREYIKKHGKPLNIYLDRHSTYKQIQPSVADNPDFLTQFERSMKDLDINIIHAYSPQAKGRVERLFKTLQNRLPKELRLAGISDFAQANEFCEQVFVPWFNDKFSVIPGKKKNLHRQLNPIEAQCLNKVFSIQKAKTIANDFTLQYQGRYFQLLKDQPTLVRQKEKVLVEERTNGEIFVSLRDKYLNFKVLPQRPGKVKIKTYVLASKPRVYQSPPPDHPWRKQIKIDYQIKIAKQLETVKTH